MRRKSSTPKSALGRKKVTVFHEVFSDGTVVSTEIKKVSNSKVANENLSEANAKKYGRSTERKRVIGEAASPLRIVISPNPEEEELHHPITLQMAEAIDAEIERQEAEHANSTIWNLRKPSLTKSSNGRVARQLPGHLSQVAAVPPVRVPDRCSCGCKMAQKEARTRSILTVEPMRFAVQKPVYRHMRCGGCGKEEWDKSPHVIMRGCNHSLEYAIQAAVQKYAHGMPLNRIAGIWSMADLPVHPKTLLNLIDGLEPYVRLLAFGIDLCIRSAYCLQLDETPILTLSEKKRCYAWGALRDERRWDPNSYPCVSFRFEDTRRKEVAQQILMGSSARVVICDGYQGYNILGSEDLMDTARVVTRCNIHARRLFAEIIKSKKDCGFSQEIIDHYAAIYAVEARLYGKPPDERVAGRTASRITMRNMKALMIIKANEISRESDLYRAISYFLTHYDSLTYFLTDGRVEPDTNLMENQFRPIAMLRKACLFAGSLPGGQLWTVFATVIGTCRLNGVEPGAYLTWALRLLNDNWSAWAVDGIIPDERLQELLPWHCPVGRFSTALPGHFLSPNLAA